MDWLQHLNPVIDWVKYEVTLPSGFVVAAVPVITSSWVALCTLKGLLRTLRAKKHAGSWFALVKLYCYVGSVLVGEGKPAVQGSDSSLDPKYAALCTEYLDVFNTDFGLPLKHDIKLTIDLLDPTLPLPKPQYYHLSHVEQAEVKKQVADMIAKGWIHPSVSFYSALILLVRKKTGELRICVDLQALNANMQLDVFPIPHISDLLDWLGRATIFSSIDLAHAYQKVHIIKQDSHKTAFLMNKGLFKYIVMPFGLTIYPLTF